MNNKKSTKRALLSSVLSLVLCMAMLIGTTFAWFTDSVSSKNNIIKSGNLDVEMEYYDGDSWEKVTADTNVFEENTLWEPGHTEVVYLKVSNLGSLALKYNLGINIVNEIESINVAGEALRLSDHIEFGAIEGVETPYADRAAARAAVTEAKTLSAGYTKAGSIEAGADADYVALVVYMPETVGNEANYRTGEVAPEITLGLNLMATQYTSESDSFNNQYDANATFDGVPAARVTKLAKMPVVTSFVTNKIYTLDTGYVFNATETLEQAQKNAKGKWIADFVAYFDKDVDSADVGLAGQYDWFSTDWLAFELEGMGTIAANKPVRMLRNADLGTDFPVNYENLCDYVQQFSCGAFAVDQAAMEGTTMTVELRLYETKDPSETTTNTQNEETGKFITIGKYSYTFGAKKVADAATLADAIANGGNIVLADDIALDSQIKIAKDNTVVLDLNGNTITGTDAATGSFGLFTNNGNLTIKDTVGSGAITLKAGNNRGWNAYSSVISNTVGGKFVLESGTIKHLGGTDMAYGIDNLTNGKGTYAETVINGGTVVSPYRAIRMFLNGVEAQNILTVNGGTIKGDNKSIWMQDPSKNANTGTLTVGENAKLIGDVYLFVTAGSTSWPVSVSINAKALKDGAKVVDGNVPAGYEVKVVDGCYVVETN